MARREAPASKSAGSDVATIKIDSPVSERKGKRKKKKKNPAWVAVSIVLKVILGLILALAVFVSGEIIYLYSAYTPFYVVGDSMYPTLNSDAERSMGGTHDGDWGNYNFGANTWYNIDFGFMQTKNFAETLERFDVVVTHYPTDSAGTGYKIKRLIGLPGESLYFDGQGELWVKKAGEETYSIVPQEGFEMRHKEYSMYSDYRRGYLFSRGGGSDNPAVLGEGEYFVVGDNRTASDDSRGFADGVRNITIEDMQGKALFVVGTCHYTPEVRDGKASPSVNWMTFRFPWAFQNL